MTDEYALADKLKQQFRGRGAAVSGMRATSTSELMHRAEMGRDPGENVSEEAFRELNGNPSREKTYRSASAHRNPEPEQAAPSRPRAQASRRSDVHAQIAGRGHIPSHPPASPSGPVLFLASSTAVFAASPSETWKRLAIRQARWR